MAEKLPDVLEVNALGDGNYAVIHPSEDPEARNVVFSGQIMAQKIMAATHASGDKEVKSIHSIFARAGNYDSEMALSLETLHSGRAWASHSVTATQGGKLMARSLVLMNSVEPDLIRNEPTMPDLPGPDKATGAASNVFPGCECRGIDDPKAVGPDGTPAMYYWMRYERSIESVAANQAILAWSQPGMIIGLALRPHSERFSIRDAHRSISTGVISHTVHFHERFDVGDWLLIAQYANYAGRGRVYGTGAVFTADGKVVSSFGQDSMARGVEGPLDPKRSM